MKVRVPESVVQRHIVATLRAVGGEVWELGTRRSRRDHHMGTRQTPGIPDIVAFLPALPPRDRRGYVDVTNHHGATYTLLFVEAKAQGGRLRPEQRRFRELAMGAHIAHLVGDLDVVIAWLIQEGYLKRDQIPHYRLPATPAEKETVDAR